MSPGTIKPREKDQIAQALQAGVVPRIGLKYLQVGRANEVTALVRDIDRLPSGGASFRIVVGEYGAGKTFFLNLVRAIALEKKCVTMNADLAPDRRIQATAGQARSLYSEAVRNMATRTKPDGGALPSIVEKFVTECVRAAEAEQQPVAALIDARLASLHGSLGGYDLATVLKTYWRGSEENNEFLKAAALRWLRGEYTTKTEARQDLGVRNIIDDTDVYDTLKLLSSFVRLAGYAGLFVVFDEMVNIYKLQSKQARDQNYEQILRMLNDVLQGDVAGLGFALGGTPEFLLDPRRGLFSYPALQSRLAENQFAINGLVDFSGPALRLQSLSIEELYVLLQNIRSVFALDDPAQYLVTDDALHAFMDYCSQRLGEAYFRTPRTTVKAFVQFLSIIEQNPTADWRQVLGMVDVERDQGGLSDTDTGGTDDDLSTLRL